MMDITVEDAKMMFSKSIVLIENKISYINQINEDLIEIFQVKGSGDVINKHIDNKGNYSFIKPLGKRLGYCQMDKRAVLLSRKPYRQYKVGLTLNNCHIWIADQDPDVEYKAVQRIRHIFPWINWLHIMFSNIYPSLENALLYLDMGYSSVALDRQFAISGEGTLWFREANVGHVDGKTVHLMDKYSFLSKVIGFSDEIVSISR